MPIRNCLISSLCLLALCFSVPVSAQDKQLSDAKTYADVVEYAQQEMDKHNAAGIRDSKEDARARAQIYLSISEKLMEVAQNDKEKRTAYNWKLTAFRHQATAGIEDAEQRIETLLEEIAANESPVISSLAEMYRFSRFSQKANGTAPSRTSFAEFNAELKAWANRGIIPAHNIVSVGSRIAERNSISAEQFVEEFTAFAQSAECTLPEEKKKELVSTVEGLLRLTLGHDPKLYGRTLDDKNFDWEKFRDKKYVLIKFTATWCGPCQMEIPGMKEAYEKYHDKGLEIVSVYMWEEDADPVATVKEHVEEKKIPWTVISEELSKKAGHPDFGPFYIISGVPTMVLVDKEGKIIMTKARGISLQNRLAVIFR